MEHYFVILFFSIAFGYIGDLCCAKHTTTTSNYTMSERALRPDASGIKESNAIVGPSAVDLFPLLACCKQIIKRLGSVKDSSCCDSVLGILGDACDILGPDATISGSILSLFDEFNNTFTTLQTICDKIDNLTGTVMIAVDFNVVFTAIDGVEELLCEKIESGFNETFTIFGEFCTTLTQTDFVNLGATETDRLDEMNMDKETIVEWLKKTYALVRSLHNAILFTGNQNQFQSNEI